MNILANIKQACLFLTAFFCLAALIASCGGEGSSNSIDMTEKLSMSYSMLLYSPKNPEWPNTEDAMGCFEPLVSTLHILPPLEESSGDKDMFDSTLIDFLTISVCEISDEENCLPIEEHTSCDRRRGLNCIWAQNYQYHLNWKPDAVDAGKTVEIHFAVADLELGFLKYQINSPRTVPMKFRIDNHPLIRARIMHENGSTAAETTEQLINEFNLGEDILCITKILMVAGYSCKEIAFVLKDEFAYDAMSTIEILKDINCISTEREIVEILMEVFNIYIAKRYWCTAVFI